MLICTKFQDDYDGLFISNGPGDPALLGKTVGNIRHCIDGRKEPIFGICMGNQLTGMAAGCETYKLPLGNRGHNQPVLNLVNGQAFITSQNHGYALKTENLPQGWQSLWVNANDGTNEGLMCDHKPVFTAQFHPEACGGPTDTEFLFDSFMDMVKTKADRVIMPGPKRLDAKRLDVKKVSVKVNVQNVKGYLLSLKTVT